MLGSDDKKYEKSFSESPFEEEVYSSLLTQIDPERIVQQYEAGGFRIDMVVLDENKEPLVAIECDGAAYHSSEEAHGWDMYRQKMLERMGFKFHRIWSTDWWVDYEVVLTSLYNRAIETSGIINNSKDKKIIRSISFNEYFLRPDGGNVEGSRMGVARTMAKIYSLYDQYKTVLIVCHRSIGRSILQPLLNMKFEDLENYFVNYGDTYVLRYDNDLGDTNWRIINEFTPKQ